MFRTWCHCFLCGDRLCFPHMRWELVWCGSGPPMWCFPYWVEILVVLGAGWCPWLPLVGQRGRCLFEGEQGVMIRHALHHSSVALPFGRMQVSRRLRTCVACHPLPWSVVCLWVWGSCLLVFPGLLALVSITLWRGYLCGHSCCISVDIPVCAYIISM